MPTRKEALLKTIRTAPYGSKRLIDAIDEAFLCCGKDDIDAALEANHRAAAGEPNPLHADFPTKQNQTITTLDLKNRSDQRAGITPKDAETRVIRIRDDRRHNGYSKYTMAMATAARDMEV